MNPTIFIQLKMLVEQAVRPVRASIYLKLRMRDQLLATLCNSFTEKTKHNEDNATVEVIKEEFGNAAEHTARLQETVSVFEVVIGSIQNQLSSRAGEPAMRLAMRQTRFVLFVYSLFFLAEIAFFYLVWDFRGETSPLFAILTLGLKVYLTFFCITTLMIVLAHQMWHALYGRSGASWPKIAFVGIAMCLLGPCAMLLGSWIHSADLQSIWIRMRTSWELPGLIVIFPYGIIFLVNLTWRILYGSRVRSWTCILLTDIAMALLVSLLVLALSLAILRDIGLSLENASAILTFTAFFLIPIDLLFSMPSRVARIRASREWESLEITS